MRILITGGAGFVGAHLATAFRESNPSTQVVVVDNLRRRGSELNLNRLKRHGVTFVHGDIRNSADLEDLTGTFDVLVEASAEPSVKAGVGGSPRYVLDTNLGGTLNCLEFARKRACGIVFLSTSRVYSIAPLRELPLEPTETRFILPDGLSVRSCPGVSEHGISEAFPTHLSRTFYGATKLASEMIIQEYAHFFDLPANLLAR